MEAMSVVFLYTVHMRVTHGWQVTEHTVKFILVRDIEYIQKTKIKYKLNKKCQPVYILYNGEMFKISLLVDGHYIQHCNMGILG